MIRELYDLDSFILKDKASLRTFGGMKPLEQMIFFGLEVIHCAYLKCYRSLILRIFAILYLFDTLV
jgi:hypothetical protein